MSKKDKKKKKKEKVVYIDDGRTIADMSGTGRVNPLLGGGVKERQGGTKRRSTAKEQWKTYTEAVKMMFFPMLVVIAILCVAFLIMYFVYG